MDRRDLTDQIVEILSEEFQVIGPVLNEDLHLKYDFNDIDVLELIDYLESRNSWDIEEGVKRELMKCKTINELINMILLIINE